MNIFRDITENITEYDGIEMKYLLLKNKGFHE